MIRRVDSPEAFRLSRAQLAALREALDVLKELRLQPHLVLKATGGKTLGDLEAELASLERAEREES